MGTKLGLVPTQAYWEYDHTEHKTGFQDDHQKKVWSDVFFNGTMMKKCNRKSFFSGVDVQLNDDGSEKSFDQALKDNNMQSIGDKKGIVNVRFFCDEYTTDGLKKLEIETTTKLRSKYDAKQLYPDQGKEYDAEHEMDTLFIDPTT